MWDDGVFDDVRKIYVGEGDSGMTFVKFVYDHGKKLVPGDSHGQVLNEVTLSSLLIFTFY